MNRFSGCYSPFADFQFPLQSSATGLSNLVHIGVDRVNHPHDQDLIRRDRRDDTGSLEEDHQSKREAITHDFALLSLGNLLLKPSIPVLIVQQGKLWTSPDKERSDARHTVHL